MTRLTPRLGALAIAALTTGAAQAQAPIQIGMMLTLSGPGGALGEHARDGFLLALEQKGGALGGMPVEMIVVDDELKPDLAVDRARALVERDGADIVVGVIFSNVMEAIFRPVIQNDVVLISPNAGPASLAGRGCHPHFFNTAWQNDQNHGVLGQYASDEGYERIVLMAPNYQAGRDAMAGVKRYYTGEVADEIFTQLGQLDFSAELARIAALEPDAVYAFMPGGMGVSLVKQFDQAGLDMPFLSAFTIDETTLPATQAAAVGRMGGAQWARDLDNPTNATFVETFEAKYGYAPSLYASQGYDTALILDAALAEAGTTEAEALSAALKGIEMETTRGDFRFGANNFPVQDFYLVEAVEMDGQYVMQSVQQVFDDRVDAYAADCRM